MEEKQAFTTFDSVSVLSLMAGVLVIVASIVSNAMIDQKGLRAQKAAEEFAAQILVGTHQTLALDAESTSARAPASTSSSKQGKDGFIGLDPWGQPYFYQVWSSDSGSRPDAVLVLSFGPNHIRDTSDEHFIKDSQGRIINVALQGDDVGVIQNKTP